MELENCILIAGPCAAETAGQLETTAKEIFQNRVPISYFRAGVWKVRSNPKDFSGAGVPSLQWLKEIKEKYQIPVCTEVIRGEQIAWCVEHGMDAVWIGARTTVNPFLVQEIAEAVQQHPIKVFIKNPITPDLKLWIGAIERMIKAGAPEVMVIHRGFQNNSENLFRNAPLWELPIALKTEFPDLKIICDPSHIAGNTQFIPEIAQLALDYGFDGLMIETHHDPKNALSDAKQQVTPLELKQLIDNLQFKSKITSEMERDLMLLRNQIAHIDTQVGGLLFKRMQLVDQLAKVKAKHNLSIIQPDQWKKAMEKYQHVAPEDALFQQFIRQYLELLHQASIDRQNEVK